MRLRPGNGVWPPEFRPLLQLMTPFQPYAKREHGSGFTRSWCIVGMMAISATWLRSRPDVDKNSTGCLRTLWFLWWKWFLRLWWFLNAAFRWKTVKTTGVLESKLDYKCVKLFSPVYLALSCTFPKAKHILHTQQNCTRHHKNNPRIYELRPY